MSKINGINISVGRCHPNKSEINEKKKSEICEKYVKNVNNN